MSMESVAKWASVIGGIGIFVCFFASSYFLSSWGSSHDDVDWNDWIVFEVEGDEADASIEVGDGRQAAAAQRERLEVAEAT